jgi:hypothetical protein
MAPSESAEQGDALDHVTIRQRRPVTRSIGQNVRMPMRVDCRNYESRTYANGEVVRKCRIDLAPEAPWRCPDDCPGFSRRMMDAGWQVGSLEKGYDVPETEPEGADVAALLDEAEEIVNSAAPDIMRDLGPKKRGRFGRRKKKK